jgi:Manganese containing catalase
MSIGPEFQSAILKMETGPGTVKCSSMALRLPSPFFAKMLQQALGGVEGEIRVMMQYLRTCSKPLKEDTRSEGIIKGPSIPLSPE